MAFPGRLRHLVRMALNPMTVGVRVLVEAPDRSILLVRHTYVGGWHFPGGGVDARETVLAAARREVREEAGVEVLGEPELIGVYLNRRLNGRDHVVLYRFRQWREEGFTAGMEIAEARFFGPQELPDAVSGGTARRLAELAGERRPDGDW